MKTKIMKTGAIAVMKLLIFSDCRQDLLGTAVLTHGVAGKRLACAGCHGAFRRHGQDNDPGVWEPGYNHAGGLQTFGEGIVFVHQDHVRFLVLQLLDPGMTSLDLCHHTEVRLLTDELRQLLSEFGTVIDDGNSDVWGVHGCMLQCSAGENVGDIDPCTVFIFLVQHQPNRAWGYVKRRFCFTGGPIHSHRNSTPTKKS